SAIQACVSWRTVRSSPPTTSGRTRRIRSRSCAARASPWRTESPLPAPSEPPPLGGGWGGVWLAAASAVITTWIGAPPPEPPPRGGGSEGLLGEEVRTRPRARLHGAYHGAHGFAGRPGGDPVCDKRAAGSGGRRARRAAGRRGAGAPDRQRRM